jgi:hypothetical protein
VTAAAPGQPAPEVLPELAALTIPQLAAAAAGLGPALAARVRETAQAIRNDRAPGRVHAADTFALVRSLTAAQEVLSDVARGFTAGADAARQEIAEDIIAVHGEQDGIPGGRLVVPDLDGTEIVARPDFGSAGRSWDVSTLVETLISVARLGAEPIVGAGIPVADLGEAYVAGLEAGARAMAGLLEEIGAFKDPAVTKVDALGRKLAGQGHDRLTRALDASSAPGTRRYKGVVVEREAAKTRRRA